MDIRCDVVGEAVSGVGDLLSKIVSGFGLAVDTEALAEIDRNRPFIVGYYAHDPVNVQDVLDDIATGAGGFWGITQLGVLTAGLWLPPSSNASNETVLDTTNISAISLAQMLPPAWRIRTEYERHWQVQSSFAQGIEDRERQRWANSGLVIVREDSSIRKAEPRAFDVPLMRSVAATIENGSDIADLFWATWSVRRDIITVDAHVDPRDVELDNTIAVSYETFQKNYRIVSVARSFGGGPAQLQLWG